MNEITITISACAGRGKSALTQEIVDALIAVGIPFEVSDPDGQEEITQDEEIQQLRLQSIKNRLRSNRDRVLIRQVRVLRPESSLPPCAVCGDVDCDPYLAHNGIFNQDTGKIR